MENGADRNAFRPESRTYEIRKTKSGRKKREGPDRREGEENRGWRTTIRGKERERKSENQGGKNERGDAEEAGGNEGGDGISNEINSESLSSRTLLPRVPG